MKKLSFSLVMLVALLGTMLSSCSESSKIAGKWKHTEKTAALNIEIIYDFKSDGTFTLTSEVHNESPAIAINASAKGTYTYKDNTLTTKLNPSDIEFSRFVIEGLSDDMLKSATEQQKQQLAEQSIILKNVEVNDNTLRGLINGNTTFILQRCH